jgi:hypothetical protein
MKKYLLCASILLISASQSWAAVTVTSFKVTLYEMDFFNSTTNQWVTAGTGTLSFDLASVNSGQTVGNYLSGAKLPNGTYTQIRLFVSRYMDLTAYDGSYYTDGSTEADPNLGDSAGGYVAGLTAGASSNAVLGSTRMSNNAGTYQTGEYSQDLSSSELEAVFYSPTFSAFTLTGASKILNISFNINGIVDFVESGPNYAHVTSPPSITITVE